MTAIGHVFFWTWEILFMEWLQSHLSASVIPIVSALSIFGEEMTMVAILGFLYWSYDKKLGKFVGLNMLIANVWSPMIKNVVLRLRPYMSSDRIQLLRKIDNSADINDVAAQGYSFPSGHSANAVTVYGSMAAYLKKKWMTVIAVLLPIVVGFSRVAVGAHFPTDVFAGWLLGLIILILLPLLSRVIKNRFLFYAILIVTALPGFFYCTSTDYYTGFGMLVGFLCSLPFEEKIVKFENTRSPIRAILRVLFGGALYFGLNTVLKMPFPKELLESGGLASHIIRSARYALVMFAVCGLYPMLFKLTAKILPKKQKAEQHGEAGEEQAV